MKIAEPISLLASTSALNAVNRLGLTRLIGVRSVIGGPAPVVTAAVLLTLRIGLAWSVHLKKYAAETVDLIQRKGKGTAAT